MVPRGRASSRIALRGLLSEGDALSASSVFVLGGLRDVQKLFSYRGIRFVFRVSSWGDRKRKEGRFASGVWNLRDRGREGYLKPCGGDKAGLP